MYKLLIVDDEEHCIATIKNLIDVNRYQISEIYECRDGLTAIDLIRHKMPDIIMMDMNMPYLDGIGFLEKCGALKTTAQIIVVSGYNDFKYTRPAIKANALDYILKPVSALEANQALARAISNIQNASVQPAMEPTEEESAEASIKLYIEENYASQISLDLLESKFFLSKECILKSFKGKYKIGVYEYVVKLRMEKAKYLLENYDYMIYTVSEMVGFNDSNYFSKAFKKYFGISPRAIRAQKSS